MTQTLRATTVNPNEIDQVAKFAQSLPQGSPIAVLLQRLIVALQEGHDVSFLENEKHLTPNQAAKLLQMSRPHLMKLINSGEIASVKTGSHHRIPASEILSFIDRRERGKAAIATAYGNSESPETLFRDAAGSLTEDDVAALDAL